MGKRNGKAAVEAEAVAGLPVGPVPAADQLALFAELIGADDDGQGGEVVEIVDRSAPGGRQVGRPPGSRNQSTLAWARFLNAGGNPLVRMQQLGNADTMRLAAILGAKPFDVLKLQTDMWQGLAKYTNSPMPVNMKIENRGAMVMAVPFLDGATPAARSEHGSVSEALASLDRLRIEAMGADPAADAEIVEIQEVSGERPAVPNGPHPNGEGKDDGNSGT